MYSFWSLDEGRGNRLKHVELWQQYRILYYAASSWLYLAYEPLFIGYQYETNSTHEAIGVVLCLVL